MIHAITIIMSAPTAYRFRLRDPLVAGIGHSCIRIGPSGPSGNHICQTGRAKCSRPQDHRLEWLPNRRMQPTGRKGAGRRPGNTLRGRC
jgi:hypothetical protein